MRILYDYQIFSEQIYGGISRYFVELAQRLSNGQGTEAQVLAPFFINNYLCDVDGRIVKGFHVPALPRSARLRRAVNRVASQYLIKKFNPDIVHETYFTNRPLAACDGVRTVITVYDMIHEIFDNNSPSGDRTRELKAAAVRRADHVICISENTRRDLIDILGVPREKTSVVYLGCSLAEDVTATARVPVGEPYILYVGLRGGYKNFETLLRAYAKSTLLKEGYSIVCFGGGGLSSHERTLIQELGISSSKICQMSGSDAVLASLYASASVFVYPSLYEGFGIPPLEAMSFGCPVVCADAGSLPEVVGTAAEMFDPSDEDHLGTAIERVVASASHAEKLVELGYVQIKQYSWDKCARDTLDAYKKTMGG